MNLAIATTGATFGLDPLAQRVLDIVSSPLRDVLGPFPHLRGMRDEHAPLDATRKFILADQHRQIRGFAIVSSAYDPHTVTRAVESMRLAQAALGERVGRVVPRPLFHGHVDGLSLAVFPYYQSVKNKVLLGRLQLLRIREPLLRWLREVIELTSRAPADDHGVSAFREPLERIAADSRLSEAVRDRANRALARLNHGDWRPRHVLAHNDLWKGNILLTAQADCPAYGFKVVDWAGARLNGFGIYDLIRIDESLVLSTRRLGRELSAHCDLLDCDVVDAWGHLLAALGHLSAHLNHFPDAAFVALAQRCCRRLHAAVAEAKGGEGRGEDHP